MTSFYACSFLFPVFRCRRGTNAFLKLLLPTGTHLAPALPFRTGKLSRVVMHPQSPTNRTLQQIRLFSSIRTTLMADARMQSI
jgi:hypothetical protein